MKNLCIFIICLCCFSLEATATFVTPESFGAKGDGITDDTKAFEKAIDTGCDIIIEKKYIVTQLQLKRKQKLIGRSGACLFYKSVVLLDGCVLKNITLDGCWETRGVTVLGSNVLISGCSFINTKNTKDSFGGLTSALWVGKYQDLNESLIKYHNVYVNNCVFDGCEPLNLNSNVPNNETVARCILSYGCTNCLIMGCVFKNLKGYYDSDYIQLRSFEVPNKKFPFFDMNESWENDSSPFKGISYSDAKTIVKNCVFYQTNCKSSIKVMSNCVRIENNTFIVNNNQIDKSYSVVRVHSAQNIIIKRNSIYMYNGVIDNLFKIGNSCSVSISKNTAATSPYSHIGSCLNITYSKDCSIEKNVFDIHDLNALVCTEYNQSVSFCRNRVQLDNYESDSIVLFTQQPNHYSYPSLFEGKTLFINNTLYVPDANHLSINLNYKYDYNLKFVNNTVITKVP